MVLSDSYLPLMSDVKDALCSAWCCTGYLKMPAGLGGGFRS